MHEPWEEQVERVQQGLDLLGIIRAREGEQMMPMLGVEPGGLPGPASATGAIPTPGAD